MQPCRHLVCILGDQLDAESSAFADFDIESDVVLMAEVPEESTHVWSSKPRTAFFFAAMRHFGDVLTARGLRVEYLRIGTHGFTSLSDVLRNAVERYTPARVVMVEPGDWRVAQALAACADEASFVLVLQPDAHFMCTHEEFRAWAGDKRQFRLEFFYRMMRKRYDVLMDGDQPLGDQWNFDSDNRGAFPKGGPGAVPHPHQITPDRVTQQVIADVEAHFPTHPGILTEFDWPVTRSDALHSLHRFVNERLPQFGARQDAMWTDEPFLYHAHLAALLNVKLLNPREVIAAAVEAYHSGHAPIEAVEGFVRQVLGWREFMRGMYWMDMPGMREANFFAHTRSLPQWYWSGDTHMRCMQHTIGQTLAYGYAHHIQRLMVTGIFALLAEVQPQLVEDWYLAVYIDAVDWVELPNVAGMALFANGGRFTSKPYIASGQYIKRMSNYCTGCRYKPSEKVGDSACPVTTLYWNFLDKHEAMLTANPRTTLMVRNVKKLSAPEREAIRERAMWVLANVDDL